MFRIRLRSVVCALVAAVAAYGSFVTADAQTTAARDPGDPKAAVPPVRYDSAFARYRPNAEAEVGAWRDANDSVGRIGGWRTYGREAIADPKAEKPAGREASASGAAAKPEHGHILREAR